MGTDFLTILRKYHKRTLLLAVFVLTYVLQTLLAPPDKHTLNHYHISTGSLKVLGLTVVIPYIVIWIIALVGYLRLKTYTDTIHGSDDGKAFESIAHGLWLLVIWPPLSAVLTGFSTEYYGAHPHATASLVILNNYFTVVLLFVALIFLYRGSVRLLGLIKTPNYRIYQPTMLAFIAFSALYTFLVLSDTVRNHSSGGTLSSYFMPDWLIITTLLIPRLIMWYLGLQTVQNIFLYRSRVKGTLYKQALRSLAIGLGGVISTLVLLRIIQSLSAPLSKLNLGMLLLVVYALLIILAVDYVLVARGAKQLQKIEEL